MVKNVRRAVVRYEKRYLSPPFDSWGPVWFAVLECGHALSIGKSSLRPKVKACPDCGPDSDNPRNHAEDGEDSAA